MDFPPTRSTTCSPDPASTLSDDPRAHLHAVLDAIATASADPQLSPAASVALARRLVGVMSPIGQLHDTALIDQLGVVAARVAAAQQAAFARAAATEATP